MNIINLVSPEKSEIIFEIFNFPDGQIGVKIPYIPEGKYRIISRFSSYNDLFKILAINQVLNKAGMKVELYCPYILSARSDRWFGNGQSFDLKIVTEILNSCNFKRIFVLDPHSDVLPALLNNCELIPSLVSRIPTEFWKNKTLVSPDAGAFKKVFKYADILKIDLITGSKVRVNDVIETQIFGDVNAKDCVIIDDICDGGRTFVQIAQKLKSLGANTVSLVVSHGIFSNGLNLEGIDEIWTTNSYREFDFDLTEHFNIHVINIF